MDDLLMTPTEAFRRLKVGRTLGYKLIRSGELPSIQLGRLRRIPLRELERYVAEKLQEAGHSAA